MLAQVKKKQYLCAESAKMAVYARVARYLTFEKCKILYYE